MSNRKCPNCGKKTYEDFRPFCSKRCKMVDLGKWFNAEYRIEDNNDSEYDSIPDEHNE